MTENMRMRASFETMLDEAGVAAARLGLDPMPMTTAKPFDLDRWGEPALIDDRTFENRVHDRTDERILWLEDGRLHVAAMIVSFRSPSDDDAGRSRVERMLDVLSAAARGEDGDIVGGWQTDHLPGTHPVILHGGRVLLGYGSGYPDAKPYTPFLPAPTRIPASALVDADRTHVRIDAALLAD